MDFFDFFDVDNDEHLRAYKHLLNRGFWPEGFIPPGTVRPEGWTGILNGKLVDKLFEIKNI